MPIKLFRSPDGRYRSDFYTSDGELVFAIAEKTAQGVLISEFSANGEIIDQIYRKSTEVLKEIGERLGRIDKEIVIEDVSSFAPVKGNATCDACQGTEIVREFDLLDASKVSEVPVVPIFVCTKCKKRFYSMGGKYLRKLIARNPELFEGEELRVKEKDEAAFVHEIQEYMIRIFASKKLAMMKINK